MNRYTKGYLKIFGLPILILALVTFFMVLRQPKNVKIEKDATGDKMGFVDNILYPLDRVQNAVHEFLEEFEDTSPEEEELMDEQQFEILTQTEDETEILFQDPMTSEEEENLGDSPVYTDAKDLLLSTERNIVSTKRLRFIKDLKNPCIALNSNQEMVGNINMDYAIQNNLDVRCLPYVMIPGFTHSGARDFLHLLSPHRKIAWAEHKNPPHFWDNRHQHSNYTFDEYTKYFSEETRMITDAFRPGSSRPDDKDLIIMEATPNTIAFTETPLNEIQNSELAQPSLLLAHKIKHVLPNMKFIVILRSPTDRLIADYNQYFNGQKDDVDFQKKILVAIEWWKHCLEDLRLPLRTCAYGKTPHSTLDKLNFEKCTAEVTSSRASEVPEELCSDKNRWEENPVDILRSGLYYAFIQDWLKIFTKEQFYFIRYEDFTEHPLRFADRIVQFLDLAYITDEEHERMDEIAEAIRNPSPLRFEPSVLSRTILDDFYQVPLRTLMDLLGDKNMFWKPIFNEDV